MEGFKDSFKNLQQHNKEKKKKGKYSHRKDCWGDQHTWDVEMVRKEEVQEITVSVMWWIQLTRTVAFSAKDTSNFQ